MDFCPPTPIFTLYLPFQRDRAYEQYWASNEASDYNIEVPVDW